MALKSKEDVEEQTTSQISFDDLEFEAEYEEEREYTTITGKPQTNVTEFEPMKTYDLDVGDEYEGVPEVVIFENKDKKYDSVRLRLIDNDEYLDCYFNMPKRDKNGHIKNIRKGFDFYRTCFDVIYSILKYRDERNVVKNGEEINHIPTCNIETFMKYLDQHQVVGVRITEGNPDSDYDSWMIYKME